MNLLVGMFAFFVAFSFSTATGADVVPKLAVHEFFEERQVFEELGSVSVDSGDFGFLSEEPLFQPAILDDVLDETFAIVCPSKEMADSIFAELSKDVPVSITKVESEEFPVGEYLDSDEKKIEVRGQILWFIENADFSILYAKNKGYNLGIVTEDGEPMWFSYPQIRPFMKHCTPSNPDRWALGDGGAEKEFPSNCTPSNPDRWALGDGGAEKEFPSNNRRSAFGDFFNTLIFLTNGLAVYLV
jgi:hypothetical protein